MGRRMSMVLGRVSLRKSNVPRDERRMAAELAIRAGRAHMAVGAWNEALSEFRRALALDPAVLTGRLHVLWAEWNTAGSEAERRAQRNDVLREVADVLTHDPNSGFCHYVVGVLRMHEGDHARAERALARSLVLDPSNRDAERHLRIVRMRRSAP